ncbi:MAG TPA: polysaccharide deacetylase family protein, partial [Candidatus Polarisedimenticolia bacterium]|nr:polysaccharide deacetylase family protein [Candidatus Polarisedimenticolia bacterium]
MAESNGVKILMYHWISGDPGQRLRHWGVTPDQFESQARQLHEGGFRTVTLGEIVDSVGGRRPAPEKAVALTFDDGYRDFLEEVAPILERFGFTATLFLVADRVGQTNAWDSRHGDPPRRLLSWREASELASRGFEIGSHTRTHRMMPRLPDHELREEILGS